MRTIPTDATWRIEGTYVRDSLNPNRLELVRHWQSSNDGSGWEPVTLSFTDHEELRKFCVDVLRYARRWGVQPGQRTRGHSTEQPARRGKRAR